RENILRPGITRFGFGIAAGREGPLYAVQTFAGPGAQGTGAEAASLAPEEAAEAFAEVVNERRAAESLPPLELSPELSTVAAGLVPDSATGEVNMSPEGGPFALLPAQAQDEWSALSTLAGSCGGCGAQVDSADIPHFLDLWLGDPAYAERLLGRDADAVGFALRAYGEGRKVAVAVLGERR